MRKGKLFIAALLVMLGGGTMSAYAQSESSLMQVHSLDATQPPQETPLSEISKILFSTTGFEVHLLDNAPAKNYAYGEVSRITFKTGNSGVSSAITADLKVKTNPVKSMLEVVGYDASQEYNLAIYSLTGQEVMRVADWKGEAINVSGYAAGIYFININSTTIKFIKL